MSRARSIRVPDRPAAADGLLEAGEPAAAQVHHADGGSPVVIVCDHAGRRIPRALGTLGLTDTELESPVAWDLGVENVAMRLAQRLEAALVLQTYSRLVIDCSRAAGSPESIPGRSEWGQVDGNLDLTPDQVDARRAAVFDPYHAAIDERIRERREADRPLILVALHSYAPSWRGIARPWHVGILHRADPATAHALLAGLRRDERLQVGDNEPRALAEGSDHTLSVHGAARGVAHVGIQIRQDLIADEVGQATWAGRLASLLRQVARS